MEEKNQLIGVVTVKDFFTVEEKENLTSRANQDKINLEFVDGPEAINSIFGSFFELLLKQELIFAIGESLKVDQLIIKECGRNSFEVLTLSEYISELQENKK